ncbi:MULTISPECIES: EVE domain-containing protein [unclassified Rhizobium]|uniref:EVE domain-containing protein n=1 Tax=unclassified Rhizobium TaxID=2613769 RepID=UPI000EA8EE67|nr:MULTISPECIES: EVE domain-containing protein [unclassified Rhizobium]AYG66804.1 EVE domain-containing protein [Rhizobium sp. CCGE531]AYG73184.1 EVE domain-containing protein [Rhizobium sp. CCGE532]
MTFNASDRIDAAPFPREGSFDQGKMVRLFPSANESRRRPEPARKSYWLAVASAEHVRIGRKHGFMQVNHGKRAPLMRIKPGDGIVYYSPSVKMGEKDGFQSFTAIGFVREGEPYLGEMGCGKAYRKDVDWLDAPEQPLRPLLGWLDFTQDKNWGYKLRFGLVEFEQSDFEFLEEILMSELEVVKQRRLQA